jgi:signal transduction histidine kinase/CheY-like chemotaxis protein
MNEISGKTIQYTRKQGLPNNSIKEILEDNSGNLWISTAMGLSKFISATIIPDHPVFKNYDSKDGLQGNEFIKRSAYKNKTGYMYFGGSNGYTRFHPDSIKDNTIVPKIIITNFLIFNKQVANLQIDSTYLEDQDLTPQIKLRHNESVLSFEFTALNYLSPEQNNFAYIMEGFEKKWNYVKTQRFATYTNLSPGEYTFRVIGSNNDNVWNENGASVKITILPPWWKTLWFKLSLGTFIFIAFYLIYRLRVYNLKNQKKLLEAKVTSRTNELSSANLLLKENQEEISLQNEELSQHRNHLETLVKDRTNELENAKKKAIEADKLKSSFLANMSHEIRTPMNAIVGFASLLNSSDTSDEKNEEYIEIIKKNSEILLVLINDILEISLIEANQLKINNSLFEANVILHELENYFQLRNTKKIDLRFTIDNINKKIVLNTDPTRFRQIMTNLLSNALKYTDSGYIHFGYNIEYERVKFYVTDTGIGINKKDFEIIFDHFHKVETNRIKLYRGAGIGLSICKKLVGLMGGDIWIESEEGKGSTFYFTLPFSNEILPAENKKKVEKAVYDKIKDLKVLVAEDEPTNFYLIESILKPHKAEVIWAKNGKEAVNYVKKNPDITNCIILMDIKMPVMGGFEALKKIREINKIIPVIAVTAYAQESDKFKIFQLGFTDYISKPLSPKRLLELININLNPY